MARNLLALEGWERLGAIINNRRGRCADELAQLIELGDPKGAAYCRVHCKCPSCCSEPADVRELRRVRPRHRTAPILPLLRGVP